MKDKFGIRNGLNKDEKGLLLVLVLEELKLGVKGRDFENCKFGKEILNIDKYGVVLVEGIKIVNVVLFFENLLRFYDLRLIELLKYLEWNVEDI